MAVNVGTSVVKVASIYDTDGNLANPSTLQVILAAPDGTQQAFDYPDSHITNPSAGVFVFTSPALMQATRGNRLWWIVFVAAGGGGSVTEETPVEVCGLHVALAS